jgi:hypothetical protein
VAPAAQTIIAIAKAGALSESEWRINMPPDYFVHQGSYDTLFEFDRGAVGLSAIGYLMKRRLEEATASAVVHLSPIARHSLEQADPATRREFQMMLDRVRDPTARRQPHHQDSLHTCDLKVWKRYAAQGPRMCYWLERDNVYVAELFSTHSEYDRFWQQFPKDRSHYGKATFAPYEPYIPLDYAAILEDIKQVGLDDQEYGRAIEEEIVSLRRQLENVSMRRNADITEAKRATRAEADSAYRKMQSSLSRQITQSGKEIAELNGALAVVIAERDRMRIELSSAASQTSVKTSAASSGSPSNQ